MGLLCPSLPRTIYDYVLRSPMIEKFFDALVERKVARYLCRTGHKPEYEELEEPLKQVSNVII